MKKHLLFFFLFAASLTVQAAKEVRIGILAESQSSHIASVINYLPDRLAFAYAESDITFTIRDEDIIYTALSSEEIAKNLAAMKARDGIHMVLVLGPRLSFYAMQLKSFPLPVIIGSIIDPNCQGIPYTYGKGTGVKNMTYTVMPTDIIREISIFNQMWPKKDITVALGAEAKTYLPKLDANLASLQGKLGLKVTPVYYEESLDAFYARVKATKPGGVYLGPFDFNQLPEAKAFLGKLTKDSIPTFAMAGSVMVENGALAGLSTIGNLDAYYGHMCEVINAIARGAAPESIALEIRYSEKLLVNPTVLDQIGLKFSDPEYQKYITSQKNEDLSKMVDINRMIVVLGKEDEKRTRVGTYNSGASAGMVKHNSGVVFVKK